MPFFKNANVNRIYIHSALLSFAEAAGGAFVLIYLLKTGLALPLVFLTLALLVTMRLVIRMAVVPVTLRIGIRGGMILGALTEAVAFLAVGQSQGGGLLLLAYVVLSGTAGSFYWTCNHAYFAKLGDTEHRGAQVSFREAMNTVVSIAAPLCGGALLAFAGPVAAFGFAAVVQAACVLPLLGAPDVAVQPGVRNEPAKQSVGRWFFISDGIVSATNHTAWSIALFRTLGDNYVGYAGVLAVAGMLGATITLFTGQLFDLGHGKRALQISYGAVAFVILAKALLFADPWTAVAANVLAAVVWPVAFPVMMAQVYNVSKSSDCPVRFHVVAEGGWDIGTAITCVAAAAMSAIGLGFTWMILPGLAGCALGYAVLSRSLQGQQVSD